MHKPAADICAWAFVWIYAFLSPGFIPGSGRHALIWVTLRNCQTVFLTACATLWFRQRCKREFPVALVSSPELGTVSLFNISACALTSHCVCLMTDGVAHLFTDVLGICICFVEWLLKSFAPPFFPLGGWFVSLFIQFAIKNDVRERCCEYFLPFTALTLSFFFKQCLLKSSQFLTGWCY